MKKLDSFLALLSNYNYVSFDIFDTLIFRSFSHYTDVFDAVERTYNDKKINNEILHGFKKTRIQCEQIARSTNKGKEVTLDMIYSYMPYSGSITSSIKEIEKEIEINNCVPNLLMIDVLKKCKAQGKRIVIITDMYLPRTVIDSILKKIAVEYDYLFISGEEGVTKRSGKLFQVVLSKLGVNPSQMVHIGDDNNNDIVQPKRFGIDAFERIQNENVYLPYSLNNNKKCIGINHLKELFIRGIQNYGTTPAVVLGYTIVGPMMWEFCEWIHKIKEEKHLEKLLFVAREGWLIMECYKLMYPKDNEIISYVRLNKNLLRLPSLTNKNNIEKFIRSLPYKKDIKWRDIFRYLGLNDTDALLISKINERFENILPENSVSVKKILTDSYYYNVIDYIISFLEDEIKIQQNLLMEYLCSIGITSQKVGLINNSIHGSGQSLIEEYLNNKNIKHEIFGIQFICSGKCEERLINRCKGWINEHMSPSFRTAKFSRHCLILEHLLFEPQGTALKFMKSTNGDIDILCDKPRTEVYDFDKIAVVQEHILQFIRDYLNNVHLPMNSLGFIRYANLLLKPRKQEALYLGSIWDDDLECDRQLLNLHAKFRKKNCLLIDQPFNTSWVEGWFSINNVPTFYRTIANIRQLIGYYYHFIPFFNSKFC